MAKARVTDLFVERPVVALVISLALVLVGLRAALMRWRNCRRD